ncbi:MAG: hypothetical protein JXD18_01800, partial [Anaerolineae bacterium]|nr:hypothetical protein [Anaerolineae bacterium]
MTHPPETTLRRVVARREATAIFDAFAPLLEGVDAALVGIDARVLVGLGEWESVPLADAFQSTDAALRAGVQVFPLPATGEPIGALVARGSALSDPHPAGALHALHRALDLFVGQAIEKRAIAQET